MKHIISLSIALLLLTGCPPIQQPKQPAAPTPAAAPAPAPVASSSAPAAPKAVTTAPAPKVEDETSVAAITVLRSATTIVVHERILNIGKDFDIFVNKF